MFYFFFIKVSYNLCRHKVLLSRLQPIVPNTSKLLFNFACRLIGLINGWMNEILNVLLGLVIKHQQQQDELNFIFLKGLRIGLFRFLISFSKTHFKINSTFCTSQVLVDVIVRRLFIPRCASLMRANFMGKMTCKVKFCSLLFYFTILRISRIFLNNF